MNKIAIDYVLVEGYTDEVTEAVRDYLLNGWELYGEPFLRKTGNGYEVIVQCVVQYKKDFAGKYMES